MGFLDFGKEDYVFQNTLVLYSFMFRTNPRALVS